MVGKAGLEPATPGLEGRCSIQLSYSPTLFYSSFQPAAASDAPLRRASAKAAIAAPRAQAASVRRGRTALK